MGKTALHVLAKRSTPHFAVRDKEREREKRKKILKMCVQKLRDIDDPETVLCRAVLINNTFKTLKYTHRHIYRPEPEAEPVYEAASDEESEEETTEDQDDDDDDVSSDESSNSDDESVPTSSSDNESDIDNDNSSVPILPQDNAAASSTYCQDELDNNFNSENCDIKTFAATDSIVHSLMMPPLLSPQIEDITNCSFYDSFSSSNQDPGSLSDSNANKIVEHGGNSETEMTASFRFTVVDSNLDESNTAVSNGYTPPSDIADYCQKSCVQSDIGNSMLIDNLLTEIVQA